MNQKDLAVVSLEHFVVNDEYMLAQIADWMGADFDAKALEYWNTDLHYIGSNHSVKRIKQDRYFFKEVKKDRRWEDVLTIEQSNFVKNHEKSSLSIQSFEAILDWGIRAFELNIDIQKIIDYLFSSFFGTCLSCIDSYLRVFW